jgi:hypothetical protein
MATLDATDLGKVKQMCHEAVLSVLRADEFQLDKARRDPASVNALLDTVVTLSDGTTMTVRNLYMVIRRHEKQYRLIEGLTPA